MHDRPSSVPSTSGTQLILPAAHPSNPGASANDPYFAACADGRRSTPTPIDTTLLAPNILSVQQHLAAIKHWFDCLVTGHVLETNPAHAVGGPRYSQNTGKTPILEKDEARALLDSIDDELNGIREADEKAAVEALPTSLRHAAARRREQEPRAHRRLIALRDRALIAALLFSWARIGALVALGREVMGRNDMVLAVLLVEKQRGVARAPVVAQFHGGRAAHVTRTRGESTSVRDCGWNRKQQANQPLGEQACCPSPQ